jgi:ABC-2 type transport system ATP-binding protein
LDEAVATTALTKSYGDLVAVHGLDLVVHRGEIFGFLGPNGAGKSTTIRMLCGLLQPSGGQARIAGFDVIGDTIEVKRRVGYLAEEPYLYKKLTGAEFLTFMGELYAVPRDTITMRADRLLALFELDGKADELVEAYSHGMRQKLALAGTLMHEPEVLFLDEPTSGMDPRSARVVKDLLRGLADQGRTVFFSTHVLEVAQSMCDRVAIINKGRIAAIGAPDELQRQASGASLEDVFLELTGGPEAQELAAFLERG